MKSENAIKDNSLVEANNTDKLIVVNKIGGPGKGKSEFMPKDDQEYYDSEFYKILVHKSKGSSFAQISENENLGIDLKKHIKENIEFLRISEIKDRKKLK